MLYFLLFLINAVIVPYFFYSMSDQETDTSEEKSADNNTQVKPTKASRQAVLGEYVIYCDLPDKYCGNGIVKAYGAGLKKNKDLNMLALVCELSYCPRSSDVETYSSIVNINNPKLRKRGVVYWPPAQEQRYVLIYEGGWGKPLLASGQAMAMGLKQDKVIDYIAKPLVNLLMDYSERGFVHGAIRANNIYDCGSSKYEKIMLGDGLSTSCSATQPVLFEPIERAMADPVARGKGIMEDDLYSFGVTLAVLLRAIDPLEGLSDDEVIRHKLEYGSYATVSGKDRFTGSVLELLRGLLHDDPAQRWNLEDVALWLEGQRLSPKQTSRVKKAMRPITFNGRPYYYMAELAFGFEQNLSEATKLIEDGTLVQWVERSIEDTNTLERLVSIENMLSSKGRGGSCDSLLACHLSMALDPTAPIRYKGLRLRGGGVGPALSKAIILKEDVKPFVDLLLNDLIVKWMSVNRGSKLDFAMLKQKYDECKRALMQGSMGHGIERCSYVLNEQAHCYSEKLAGYYVMRPEDLLSAVEELCSQKKLEGLILDRHMVAFLSHCDSRIVNQFLFDLNSSQYHKNILGNLKVFAAMQDRYGLLSLPAIARTIHDKIPAVLKRYHDKEMRDKIRSELKKYVKSGDLVKMSAILSNDSVNKRDHKSFLVALQEYRNLQSSYDELEAGMADKNSFGRSTGQDVSAIFASVISLLIILGIAYSYFISGSGF